jgi:hypothetical protein
VRAAIESLYRQYQRHYVQRHRRPILNDRTVCDGFAVPRRLRLEVIDRLVADYEGGESAESVARRHGISKEAALRLLHQRGVVRPWDTNQHRDQQDHFTHKVICSP